VNEVFVAHKKITLPTSIAVYVLANLIFPLCVAKGNTP
jgi:hypothetical protein